ncbi:MAG: TlpA disulfide reductase family protein [Pyrinomonadaceae bacterium]
MFHCFRRFLLSLLLVAAFAMPLAAQQAGGEDVVQLPLADDAAGARSGVADYELQTLKGQTLRLSSLRGRVVLLDFFLAACPHCREHAPFIADLSKRHRDRGLTVIALCTNNPFTERELVERYVKDSNLETEVAFVSLEVMMSFIKQRPNGSYGVPEAVLFGSDGRLAARFTAWEAVDKPAIERAIETELNKKNPGR